MGRAIEGMVRGYVPANRDVLGGILSELGYYRFPHGVDPSCDCCRACREFLEHHYRRSHWDYYPFWDRSERYVGNCGPWAYALGAAEATTVFEEMSRAPIQRLKEWSEVHAPLLNSAIATLERKLHEKIFGKL